jgi:hypothetical protein
MTKAMVGELEKHLEYHCHPGQERKINENQAPDQAPDAMEPVCEKPHSGKN